MREALEGNLCIHYHEKMFLCSKDTTLKYPPLTPPGLKSDISCKHTIRDFPVGTVIFKCIKT